MPPLVLQQNLFYLFEVEQMPLNNFNYSVTWTDFALQSSRPTGAHEDAHIQVHYDYTYQLKRNGNAVIINSADVNMNVVLPKSWVVSSQMTNDLLSHEQGHYDITALGARELYNALLQLSAASGNVLQTRAAQLNQRIQQKIDRVNIRYDTQTNHSQDTAAQQTWQQRIAAEKQKPDGSIDNLPQ